MQVLQSKGSSILLLATVLVVVFISFQHTLSRDPCPPCANDATTSHKKCPTCPECRNTTDAKTDVFEKQPAKPETRKKPDLSIVVVIRNDDYGENASPRYKNHFNLTAAFASKHNVNYEHIIVEWNPPPGKPPVADLMPWPSPSNIRIVTVPPKYHDALGPNGLKMPVMEYIAKNVGCRRARGKWILLTNPDTVWSEELWSWFGNGSHLNVNAYYRSKRYDIGEQSKMPQGDLSPAEKLAWFSANVGEIRHDGWEGDFLLVPTFRVHGIRAHYESPTHSGWDTQILCKLDADGMAKTWVPENVRTYHQWHSHASHKDRPGTNFNEMNAQCAEMRRTRRSQLDNPYTWGLGFEELEETIIKDGQVVGKETPDYRYFTLM